MSKPKLNVFRNFEIVALRELQNVCQTWDKYMSYSKIDDHTGNIELKTFFRNYRRIWISHQSRKSVQKHCSRQNIYQTPLGPL